MIHIMNERHDYRSPLRQEQARRTREQILEGLIQAMARDGIADLSIPAIAREAGVSVPTIYRYFRTKRELVEALSSYTMLKIGGNMPPMPHSPEELIAIIKMLFTKYEGADEMLRAAVMSEQSYELRKELLPQRLKLIEEALRPVAGRFNEADWIHVRNSVFILTTTAAMSAFKDYLNLSGEEAADTVAWAIRTLTGSTSPTDTEEKT
jgi:AcrR family transcriptional regulator